MFFFLICFQYINNNYDEYTKNKNIVPSELFITMYRVNENNSTHLNYYMAQMNSNRQLELARWHCGGAPLSLLLDYNPCYAGADGGYNCANDDGGG